MAQGRRIAVALRREKFVFRAKIRRIREKLFAKLRIYVAPRKIHKNFFCKFFVFWAKIRSQIEKFEKIRKCDFDFGSPSQMRRRFAGENATQKRIVRNCE